jgi:hypothetical protein
MHKEGINHSDEDCSQERKSTRTSATVKEQLLKLWAFKLQMRERARKQRLAEKHTKLTLQQDYLTHLTAKRSGMGKLSWEQVVHNKILKWKVHIIKVKLIAWEDTDYNDYRYINAPNKPKPVKNLWQ